MDHIRDYQGNPNNVKHANGTEHLHDNQSLETVKNHHGPSGHGWDGVIM
jgi:hypothetical protein